MKADKGGALVIMDIADYNIKAYRLLNDQNIYIKLLNVPSITSVQNKFNAQVRKIAHEIADVDQRSLVLGKVSDRMPSLPYFYGIPKAHKAGCPLRPIVATCGAPQSKLAEWLARQLSHYLGKFSSSHLLHSYDFVQRIRDLGVCSGRMMSLDVTALFTNVPLDFVLDKLKEKELEGLFSPVIPIDQFLALIRLCVSSTVFTFNGEGYQQKFGVAMGSPLSPILANLCMEFVESDLISNCPPEIKPHIWLRYVDDVFVIYKKDDICFDRFVEYVNNIIPSIKFTVEYESNNSLPFLDVIVYHDSMTHNFSFSVYRKPTNSEMYIHFFHTIVHKSRPM